MTLKTRIVLYLTFHSKSIQIPRTFLWPFSQTFGLTYSPLTSAKLYCSSWVTLENVEKSRFINPFGNTTLSDAMHRFFLQTSELIQENYKLDLQAVRSWNSGVVKNVWYIIQFVISFFFRSTICIWKSFGCHSIRGVLGRFWFWWN